MDALHYTTDLIRFDTVSSKSNVNIANYLDETLISLGFETERIRYETNGVEKVNVIGRKGSGHGGVAYFGHTDVVPVDNWSQSDSGPFEPLIQKERLYGRGSTDMKGSLACMLAAAHALQSKTLRNPIYLCFSADEELDHRGIIEVTRRSSIYHQLVAGKACGIVGEPTGMKVVYAHKGGVQIVVTAKGKAAHSSTREGVNANLAMIPFLQHAKLIHDETEKEAEWWDEEFDPPTVCLNIGINDHTPAVNITAPQSICTLCFRPMPPTDVEAIIGRIRDAAESCGLDFELRAQNPAFRRAPDSPFAKLCAQFCDNKQPGTVAYGSEAGNLSDIQQLVVLGPGDIQQAHKDDEWISLAQLEKGSAVYQKILESCCIG